MQIALVGHGRMNQAVERQATERGHTVAHILKTTEDLQAADLSEVDIAMEFSVTEAALKNTRILAEKGISTVSGTTGWTAHMDEARQIVEEHGIGFLWSANFSIGVNMFWKILERACHLANAFEEYDVFAHEFHHNAKQDSPSGTALVTGNLLLEHLKRKDTLVTETLQTRPPQPNELHFSSTRGGSVPGTHLVSLDSPADTIEIRHTARNSDGFARGAVLVSEWLQDKSGFFTMDDFFSEFSPTSS